jgi:glycosyltransferase involved in cell wall biosynthesis
VNPTVDIVVPAYNEVGSVRRLYERVFAVVNPLPYAFRLIFVDDGSSDGTAGVCAALAKEDPRVGFIQFSRNFGHQAALTAALDHADADAVITLDADLQHPPEAIPEFLAAWRAGGEIVHGVRRQAEGLGFFKRTTSHLFYVAMSRLSEVPLVQDAPDFRLLDAKVVRAIRTMREQSRFLRGMFAWIGFTQVQVPYAQADRKEGASKYSARRMIAFGVTAVLSFSRVPLRIATIAGGIVSAIAFLYGIYAFLQHVVFHHTLPGWTSLALTLSFLSGAQMVFLGLIGEYLGQVLSETKHRPLYVVRENQLPPLQNPARGPSTGTPERSLPGG